MTDERYITVEEAAALLQISTRQVHRYGGGEQPRLRKRKAGRRILFHHGDVEVLAKDLTIARTPPALPPRKETPLPASSPLLPDLADRPNPLTVGELITLHEAAEYAGLSPDALANYARLGRLRARKVGRQWLTTRAALDEYLESRR